MPDWLYDFELGRLVGQTKVGMGGWMGVQSRRASDDYSEWRRDQRSGSAQTRYVLVAQEISEDYRWTSS